MGGPLRAKREDARRLGEFLRRVREQRRLSLDAVAEMSAGYSERLTKSHLSRIENGQAEPSFRKLFALSRIYGVPLVSLAERFELDLERELRAVDLAGKSDRRIHREATALVERGRHNEALALLLAALDRLEQRKRVRAPRQWQWRFRLAVINCLVHLGHYELAKAESESLLSEKALAREQRLQVYEYFIMASYYLGRYTVALMALDRAEHELRKLKAGTRYPADFAALKAIVHDLSGEHGRAVPLYRKALRSYERLGSAFEACKTRINLGAALVELGQLQKARAQLTEALAKAERGGYERLQALAMSFLASCAFHGGELGEAERWAIRSNAIARARQLHNLIFRNCYYLWKAARARGDAAATRAHERSLRSLLGRVEGDLPEAHAFRAYWTGGER